MEALKTKLEVYAPDSKLLIGRGGDEFDGLDDHGCGCDASDYCYSMRPPQPSKPTLFAASTFSVLFRVEQLQYI